ncbi:PREDICTED: uncharacterized protein LOC105359619 [Ceratosolen solmsi marchali]|uniref:Uncharacterized protein LOC105359619 n=1 Tax=Ceratosolen solmsi marchali TaxID=326594 RepID=A0AAJ6VL26_9HYME|nr:PREDICTED: uncharacterized protein LOC105359619 [Ceratosolen solmsi marchali]
MNTFLIIIFTVTVVSAKNGENSLSSKKDKRGVNYYGQPTLNVDSLSSFPNIEFGTEIWNPSGLISPLWKSANLPDLTLGKVQLQATHNLALQALHDARSGTPSIVYSPDVIRAIQFAKEANNNVHLAQQRVDDAKQAAILQQRIALSKEAAAREAAHRSAEIATHAELEARTSAKQLVALQQRLATLKDSVAAAQRYAAARETAAAAAIQRNAADTAAELRKQDVDHQVMQSEREAKARDLVAAKENAISQALHNNVARKHAPVHHPWGR